MVARPATTWRDAQECWDAAASNQLETLLKCLAKGADATWAKEGAGGATALHVAAGRGFLDVVKALCRHDPALADLRDEAGNTPITCAKQSQQPHVVYFLKNVEAPAGLQSLPGVDDPRPNFYKTGGLRCARRALVIGQAHYKVQSLHHAASDAQLVSRRLQDMQFDVFVGVNLSRQELLNQFQDFVMHVGPQDFALVYYTGLAARRGNETVLIGTDRMFGVAEEGPQLSVEAMSEALLRRGGPDGLSQPTENERGVTMLVVNACYRLKDSSGPAVVAAPWHPSSQVGPSVAFDSGVVYAGHERVGGASSLSAQPELGSTSLEVGADGHFNLRFDYGRKAQETVDFAKMPPVDRRALQGSDNSQFLVPQPSPQVNMRHPWRTPLPIPFPFPRYESPATRIFAAGFQSPASACPLFAPAHAAAKDIKERDFVPLIREQGMHPLNVQARERAVVIYAHTPSDVLPEPYFDPVNWSPEDPSRSLLAPQEAQVQKLLQERLSFQTLVPTRLERLAARAEEVPPSSTHWVLPTDDVRWPYAVEKDHLARYGGEYRHHGDRPREPLEKLGGEAPPPSLFAACVEEALGAHLHLREAVLKLGANVTERSGRVQVPFLSLGTRLESLLL